jgi:hypothetical protein
VETNRDADRWGALADSTRRAIVARLADERYDVSVTLGDGVFPLTALAEGKNATALALIRTAGEPTSARPSWTAGSPPTPGCGQRRRRGWRPGRPT